MYRTKRHRDYRLYETILIDVQYHKSLFLPVFLIRMMLISDSDIREHRTGKRHIRF
jgi:hypothetical protein